MDLDRRSFLQAAGLTAAAASLATCAPGSRTGYPEVTHTVAGLVDPRTRTILDRLTYGATTSELLRVAEIGLEGWIEEQLAHDPLPELDLRWRLRNLGSLDKNADALEGYKRNELLGQLRQATLLKQIYSQRQLFELVVEFWTDHFNISVEKGRCWYLKVVDDREVIRKHALGRFNDLLHASARSPAMLEYLDNQANRKGAPNENYARELLELHTLGIDGGYSQSDIEDLARGLTGWTIKEHFWHGQFTFNDDLHDRNPKSVLGVKLPGTGQEEVLLVLDHLASHPSTALHLAYKLVQRFVCDDPQAKAAALVEAVAQAFMVSGGDLSATLRVLFLDGMARTPEALGVKFKRPVDFIVSALRLSGTETQAGRSLQAYLARMGQSPFAWPTPDGPPQVATHWQTNLAPRWSFALRLANGSLAETELPVQRWLERFEAQSASEILNQIHMEMLGSALPVSLGNALLSELQELGGIHRETLIRAVIAGVVASPAFQYRGLRLEG